MQLDCNQQNINTQHGKNTSLFELWNNYRAEVIFFFCFAAFAVVCHYLSRFIPVDFFDRIITPIQNSFVISICLFGAWLLFRHADGLRIRKIWAWTLMVWGVADCFFMLQTCCFDMPVLNIGPNALTAYELLVGNFLGWLMLLYPTEALRPGWMNLKRAAMQLLPMLALVGIDYLVPINLTPIIALYPVGLFILVHTHLREYRKWCEENYSSMDNIDVQWIVRYLLMLLVIGGSFLYMCLTKNPVRAFAQQWLLLFLFVYSTEQILFRKDPWAGNNELTNERGNEFTIEENSTDRNKLEQWFDTEKPYIRSDFQLMDLREVLPMNRTYLSQFINVTYGCTFYKFVNRYRIEEAKRLMHEFPELKMADIAFRSGFSSQPTFTKIFTKETGYTPSEWYKKFSFTSKNE